MGATNLGFSLLFVWHYSRLVLRLVVTYLGSFFASGSVSEQRVCLAPAISFSFSLSLSSSLSWHIPGSQSMLLPPFHGLPHRIFTWRLRSTQLLPNVLSCWLERYVRRAQQSSGCLAQRLAEAFGKWPSILGYDLLGSCSVPNFDVDGIIYPSNSRLNHRLRPKDSKAP